MSSAATRRRALPATSRGRTPASRALAWAAERSFFAPPGISSSSRWCSWLIILVWSSPKDRRRSTRMRSAVSCWSSSTGRSPASGSRPRRPSERQWRRSCDPDRSRRPALARTASGARRRPPGHQPAAAARRGDRCRCSLRSPRPGPATAAAGKTMGGNWVLQPIHRS